MENLKLKWRKTWPDRPDDYVGFAEGDGHPIGRIIKGAGGNWANRNRWSWYYQAFMPGLSGNKLPSGGIEDTARSAALEIEKVWSAAIASRQDLIGSQR